MARDAQNQAQSVRLFEYLDREKLQDELRTTPKSTVLSNREPSNNDPCTMPCPDAKFSTLTLSSRKISSNLQLLSSQSPAKKVKKLINFFGGGMGVGLKVKICIQNRPKSEEKKYLKT